MEVFVMFAFIVNSMTIICCSSEGVATDFLDTIFGLLLGWASSDLCCWPGR